MKEFTDQMGRTLRVEFPPKRIISLVPSQTELLFDLDLDQEVIGITKFCIHPSSWFQSKQRVGGTKQVNLERVRSLKPDLIIGNKEENTQSDIELLVHEFPVWMSDIENLTDALEMIQQIGELTHRSEKANHLKQSIQSEFNQLAQFTHPNIGKSVAYLIWKNPYMVAGKNTFIDSLFESIGLTNFFDDIRYPTWDPDSDKQPDLIFLSSEPYPFKEIDIAFFQKTFPSSKVQLVDGEYFSWYGSRLMGAPTYFRKLLNSIR